MRKRMIVILAIGISCLFSGIIMAGLNVTPKVIPITFISIGSGLISSWFAVRRYIRGDALIFDEMQKRIDMLSGSYTSTITLFFILVLCIINFFYPLPLSIAGLLMTMMLYMSLSFILIRFYLLKWGK